VKRILYKTFAKLGGDRLLWRVRTDSLRILCYHGICENEVAGQQWVPTCFVTAAAFERQLDYLQKNARVLPLSEAVGRLRDASLPAGSVSITFDDGYANNLTLAYPLLHKYRMPATIFLSSAYMESGELFPFLQMQLIAMNGQASGLGTLLYKSDPLDKVCAWASLWWPKVKQVLTRDQLKTLRPMTIAEVRSADTQLIEFGAHSHTHCILKNETRERRQEEIVSSIRKVAQWTERPVRLFSYPNGERGDFGEEDKQVLRANGIKAAVTGIGGANHRSTDLLELRRYPVGLYHDAADFRAEVTGFRTAVLAVGRGLGA
jgi:peptidoglycan/xylan/chitin deacetylase (PgdA/CDA1 family)